MVAVKTLDLRHLSYFIALAEERSFTRAAARLHIAQPSLSAQLARLEEFLGFALFLRSTRTMELTPEGEQLLPEARSTLEASTRLLELTRQIREGAENTIRVGGASLTTFRQERQDLFAAMEAQLPELAFEFIGLPQTEQLDALRRWQIDVSFYVGYTLDESTEFEHLVVERLPVDLLVGIKSPLAKAKAVALEDLRNQPVVIFGRQYSPILFDQLAEVLQQRAGARLIVPSDSHPFLIALYAAQHDMSAIHVEWLHHGNMIPPGLVQRRLASSAVFVEMSLVRLRKRAPKQGVNLFWQAAQWYLQSRKAAVARRSRKK
ncbi:MAG: LysR family transcriptional regulator [Steroidobacteraceae bacterium]